MSQIEEFILGLNDHTFFQYQRAVLKRSGIVGDVVPVYIRNIARRNKRKAIAELHKQTDLGINLCEFIITELKTGSKKE